MKYTTALALALAPLTMAVRVPRDHHEKQQDYVTVIHDGMKNNYGGSNKGHTEIIIIWANPGGGAETTTINQKVTVTQTVTAVATKIVDGSGHTTTIHKETQTAHAPGASHTVTVGGPGGLIFAPEQLNDVPVGDFVVFEFLAQNHTVTQSPFDTPCDALPGGMDTGFIPNKDNTVSPPPQVAMQIMSDKPLWFYCKQGNHCGQGMVFSINPTAEKTHAMFKEKAIAQKGDGKATPITGGEGEKPAESPAAPPPATTTNAKPPASVTSSASAPEGTGATPGKGTVGPDGSCHCVVACAAGSFPAIEAQGLGAFGGEPGALPVKMAAIR